MGARIEAGFETLRAAYGRGLTAALRRRPLVFMSAAVLLAVSGLSVSFLGFSFVPVSDSGEILVSLTAPSGWTLEQTMEKSDEVERLIRDRVPELETAVFFVGQDGQFSARRAANRAFGRLTLVARAERSRGLLQIIDLLRGAVAAEVPDARVVVTEGGKSGQFAYASGGQGFIVRLSGEDLGSLEAAAGRVETLLRQDPSVFEASTNVSFDSREIVQRLNLDTMGTLGISPREAGLASRVVFHGIDAGEYRGVGGRVPIVLSSTAAGKSLSDDLLHQLVVKNPSGKPVPFSSFAALALSPAPAEIHHHDQLLSIQVAGSLIGEDVRGVTQRMRRRLAEEVFPPGVRWELSGSGAQVETAFGGLLSALGIAVFLVYAVMVIQFERFLHPLVIMFSVPFAVVGMVGGLLAFNTQLSIVAFLGLIALAGIVVNNAIVLIDYVNLLRRERGYRLVDALVEGGSTRLKPILMTTLTTLFGVVPMAIGLGEGSEIYSPLGQALLGGLTTSTLITLFIVPLIYHLIESRREKEAAS